MEEVNEMNSEGNIIKILLRGPAFQATQYVDRLSLSVGSLISVYGGPHKAKITAIIWQSLPSWDFDSPLAEVQFEPA